MKTLPLQTVLLLIDIQKGFDSPYWGSRNNPQAEGNMSLILQKFRETQRPVVHIQHMSTFEKSPLRPGQPGNEFKDIVLPLPHELVVQKTVNSAFIGTDLEKELRALHCNTLVIIGISTNHCVSTTTRMAGNMGYETYVIEDATHAFEFTSLEGKKLPAQLMHDVGLAELHGEFAQVLKTQELLQRLGS